MFADIDKDGDFDFYYTGMYNYTYFAYDQFTYLNNGSNTVPSYMQYSNEHNHDFKNQRIFYDWNKDGLSDYFRIDTYNNSIDYWKNAGNVMMPTFTLDYTNAPVFTHGLPARLVDLNGDSAAEAFTADGRYSTLAPVALIKASVATAGGRSVIRLSSAYQSDDYQYSWELNGQTLEGITRPTFYALQPGQYTLFVKNNCGTGVSLSYLVSASEIKHLLAGAANKQASSIPALQIQAYRLPRTQIHLAAK